MLDQKSQIRSDETLLTNYIQLNSKLFLSWVNKDRFNLNVWLGYLKSYLNIYRFVTNQKKYFLLVHIVYYYF